MREILFRGISEKTNQFVYGYYMTNGSDYEWIAIPQSENDVHSFKFERIIPESNGQNTNLKDKNGNCIYEGDILQVKTQSGRVENFTVEYGIHRRDMASGWTVDIPGFSFVNSESFPTFPIAKNYLNGHDLDIIEIIGNKFEHPHLLTNVK